jgi:methionine synthase I (cobalamin-dependent)
MNIHPHIQDLTNASAVITDGAWGTKLQLHGFLPGEAPDLWNLTHLEKISEVARAYVVAGSQIILTNTFGPTDFGSPRLGRPKRLKTSMKMEFRFRSRRQAAAPWSLPSWGQKENY